MTKKNVARGEGNRVADGQRVFDPNDGSYVERTTPLQTKMRQMRDASELGIDPQREKSTSRKRANKEVKPI